MSMRVGRSTPRLGPYDRTPLLTAALAVGIAGVAAGMYVILWQWWAMSEGGASAAWAPAWFGAGALFVAGLASLALALYLVIRQT